MKGESQGSGDTVISRVSLACARPWIWSLESREEGEQEDEEEEEEKGRGEVEKEGVVSKCKETS